MITFPAYARVGRVVAKEKFYDKVDYATKMLFQNEIAKIIWEYKLSPDTINIAAKKWPEIEVFRIELKGFELSQKVLKTIDSSIPYPILFIVTKNGLEKAIISYKERSQNNTRFAKVDTYFETEWNNPVLDNIKIDGLDVDAVFYNFVRQVAGERLNSVSSDNANQNNDRDNFSTEYHDDIEKRDIKNEIERMKEHEKLQKQIATLDRRIKSEPSIGKKQQLAEEKCKLMQRLEKE